MLVNNIINISLTENEVREIIADKCRQVGYTSVSANDISFDIRREPKGNVPGEYETVFKGCKISYLRGGCDKKIETTSDKLLKVIC